MCKKLKKIGQEKTKKIKETILKKKKEWELRKRASKLTDNQRELYKKWEEKWNKIRKSIGIEEDIFLALYKEIFERCSYKANNNKFKNNFFKFLFIGILGVGFVVIIWLFIGRNSDQDKILTDVVSSGAVFLLIIWGASIVNKWIEIKKYQETWIRHSDHMYMLEKEMLKFIEEMEPYEVYPARTDEQRVKKFIQNILDIEKSNQDVFSQNMNNKEKELMDVFDKMGLTKKKEEE